MEDLKKKTQDLSTSLQKIGQAMYGQPNQGQPGQDPNNQNPGGNPTDNKDGPIEGEVVN
jgi:hypothetical protein